MTAVGVAFQEAAAAGRAVLVGYLPAGFPTVKGAIAAIPPSTVGNPAGR